MDDRVISGVDGLRHPERLDGDADLLAGSLPAFPALLERFRAERGLSKAELAKRTGLDPSTITRFEQGARMPERETILQLAGELGIPAEQRSIDRSELYIADEAFFCGTGVQVAWIGEIDGREIGGGTQGPIAKQLYDTLFAIFRGQSSDHSDWVTPVAIDW